MDEATAGTPAAHPLHWCDAGHPPPIPLAPNNDELAPEHGSHVECQPSGLVERPGAAMDASMREPAGLFTGRHHLSAEQLCDHLLTSSRTGAADDIVITVLQTGAVAPSR
ncbi:hypothetical protein ACQP00_31125 [Dactylosporangium sp. CS-047395]|uniref:hypothetical protein n=1 Tax=Dactylosporangium sp. CS-047395 TaxID=3239936 RepID=UPI003D8F6FDC